LNTNFRYYQLLVLIGHFRLMIKEIHIVNGPNLNLLGTREVDIYGTTSFEDFFKLLQIEFSQIKLQYYQSNVEGEIINYLQTVGFSSDGILLNAGGYTHTSVAIADTVSAIKAPVIEVHISNIFARESFRHISLFAKNCKGSISGFGLQSYKLALLSLL
jgi:3-dehydroquinate dehydratase II